MSVNVLIEHSNSDSKLVGFIYIFVYYFNSELYNNIIKKVLCSLSGLGSLKFLWLFRNFFQGPIGDRGDLST